MLSGIIITLRIWAFEQLIAALNIGAEIFKHAVPCDAAKGGRGSAVTSVVEDTTGDALVPGVAEGDEEHIRANRGCLQQWILDRVEPSTVS